VSRPDPLGCDAEAMLALAKRLLADRERLYPGAVAAGRMTREAASLAIGCMRALVDQWRAIAARDPVEPGDPFARHGVSHYAIRRDLAEASARAAARAAAAPGDEHAAALAEAVAAMAWAQRPWAPGMETPHCTFLNDLNRQIAVDRAGAAPPALAA